MRLDGSLTERYGLRQVREHPDFTISKVLTVIKWPIITTLTSNHRQGRIQDFQKGGGAHLDYRIMVGVAT